MEILRYKEIAKNPDSWFEFSRKQKMIADSIELIMIKNLPNEVAMNTDFENTIDYRINAYFHYGIAIENGFKGLIVKYYPEEVYLNEKYGKVFLDGIGKSKNRNHDLLKLAKDSNIYERINYEYDEEYDSLNEVLSFLSDAIKWSPKYPLPMNNEDEFQPNGKVPIQIIYGFHIHDIIEPLFKIFETEMKSKEIWSDILSTINNDLDIKDKLC